MLDIKDFLTHIKKSGVQRNNRFVLSINIPPLVMDKFNAMSAAIERSPVPNGDDLDAGTNQSSIGITKAISLMAVDISTPGLNIQTSEFNLGVKRKIADGRNTGELNITFRCSADMSERKLFDSWASVIYRDDGTVSYYDDYVSAGIDIFSMNINGGQTYRVSMEEAYPSTITELPFNAEQENGILMFQVTFNYRRLHNVELDGVESAPPEEFVASSNTPTLSATSLPSAPITNNLPLMIFDIYKNIDRVKFAIENGTLSKEMGTKLILNIMRDVNASGANSLVTNTALTYANNLLYVLGRK